MTSRATSRAANRHVEELVSRFALSAAAADQLASLLRCLTDDPLAPTSVRDPAKAIDDHLADSLVALELPAVRNASAVADIGSGAGVPALPLAVALPAAHFTLIESAGRKCEFLRRAISVAGIVNADVIHARVEAWTQGAGHFDLATARALAAPAAVVEYAAPLLRLGGSLVLWRGQRDAGAERAAAAAADLLGMQPSEVRAVRPYPAARNRHLHLMLKVKETPPGFPRRPGLAVKRPLAT